MLIPVRICRSFTQLSLTVETDCILRQVKVALVF